MAKAEKATGADGYVARSHAGRSTVWIILTAIAFIVWQIIMVPRLIVDAKLINPEALAGVLPIEAIAITLAGLIGHGVHVAAWFVGSFVLAGLIILARLRGVPSRRR